MNFDIKSKDIIFEFYGSIKKLFIFICGGKKIIYLCSLKNKTNYGLNILSNEKNISAIRKKEKKQARFQRENVYAKRQKSFGCKESERQKEINCKCDAR